MRVLGEGVAIEACIEDVSCASPRAGRHSMLETPWSLVICVRRVCPRVCAFPCHVTLTAHRSHLPDNFITLPKTRPRTSRCHGPDSGVRSSPAPGPRPRSGLRLGRPPHPPLAETRDGAVKRARTAAHYRSTHILASVTL